MSERTREAAGDAVVAELDPAGIDRVVGAALAPGRGTWVLALVLAAGVALGAGLFLHQLMSGFVVTGKNNPVDRGRIELGTVVHCGTHRRSGRRRAGARVAHASPLRTLAR